MKKLTLTFIAASLLTACGGSPQPTANTNSGQTESSTNKLVVTGHKTDSQPAPATQSNSTGGSPMQKAADIAAPTAAIEKAEMDFKAKPGDAAAKKALAKAYFDRAFILTNAAQYSAALGDFRKGLKLDPSDTKAKDMHDQIIEIYGMVGKPAPKEGEEAAPLGADKPKQ